MKVVAACLLDQFMKNCIPHDGAKEDCEEEGVAETKCCEMSAGPIPQNLELLAR